MQLCNNSTVYHKQWNKMAAWVFGAESDTPPENDWGLQPANQYHSWAHGAHKAAYMAFPLLSSIFAQSYSPPATTIPALERSGAGAFPEMQLQ